MKTCVRLSLTGLLAASSLSFAVAPPNGWYAGVFGELSKASSIDFTLTPNTYSAINGLFLLLGVPPLNSPVGQVDYSPAGGGGGQVGYRCCGWRFEGEVLFNYSPYNQVTLGGIGLKTRENAALAFPFSNLTIHGNTSLGAALFNIYYDFYDYDYDDLNWLPYVGLGVGYGYIQDKNRLNFISPLPFVVLPNITVFDVKESLSTPVGQAIAGLSYLFNERFSAGLDYRYITTKAQNHFNERFSIQTLNLNVNYWFG